MRAPMNTTDSRTASGPRTGDKTPVGERQVASVAALPMSSRFDDRFAAIER